MALIGALIAGSVSGASFGAEHFFFAEDVTVTSVLDKVGYGAGGIAIGLLMYALYCVLHGNNAKKYL